MGAVFDLLGFESCVSTSKKGWQVQSGKRKFSTKWLLMMTGNGPVNEQLGEKAPPFITAYYHHYQAAYVSHTYM